MNDNLKKGLLMGGAMAVTATILYKMVMGSNKRAAEESKK